MISNYAREQVALLIGHSGNNIGSGYLAIGSGSGTLSVATTGLLNYWDRNQFTGGSVDCTTAQQITMLTDFNSIELSGLTARQFGVFVESSGGKAWQVEQMNAITFNGTQELQVEITWQVF
jgi:hypothetical protein